MKSRTWKNWSLLYLPLWQTSCTPCPTCESVCEGCLWLFNSLSDMNYFCTSKVTKVLNIRLAHSCALEQNIGSEWGAGKILASWKVFFSKAENVTSLLCASIRMVNCRVLMKMPVHMLSCLLSCFFSRCFVFGTKTFSGLFFRGRLSRTHSSQLLL